MRFYHFIKRTLTTISNKLREHPLRNYIFMILIFGAIYYIVWLFSMDSFIINDREGSKILEYIVDEKQEPILSLSSKRERLENVIKRDRLISKKISENSANEKNIEDSLHLLIKVFQESKMLAYQKDSASRFETYNRQLDSLTSLKNLITSSLDSVQKNNIGTYLSYVDINIADIRLKKSTEDLLLIKKYVEGNTYYNEELEHKINSINDSLNTIRHNLDILRLDSLSSIRQEYASAFSDLKETMTETINPLDFLFYSIGIATTTTFGDFTANSIFIKFLTSLELIIGIFLIACLVGKLQIRLVNEK